MLINDKNLYTTLQILVGPSYHHDNNAHRCTRTISLERKVNKVEKLTFSTFECIHSREVICNLTLIKYLRCSIKNTSSL